MPKFISNYFIILGFLPLIAWAKPDFGDMPPHCDKHPLLRHKPFAGDELPPFLSDLELTQTQMEQVKKLFSAKGAQVHDNMQDAFKLKAELHQLPFSNEYTEDKAKALISSSIQTHAQAMLEKARLDNAIFLLLTSEQKEQLKAHMAKAFNKE